MDDSVILKMVKYFSRHHKLWALWQFILVIADLYFVGKGTECAKLMVTTLEWHQLVKVSATLFIYTPLTLKLQGMYVYVLYTS